MPAKKLTGRGESFADFYKRRTSEIEGLGLTSFVGKVNQIGYDENNPRFVFFYTAITGWGSNWDAKSYELAKISFLYDKRLWIIAKGSPVAGSIKEMYLIAW